MADARFTKGPWRVAMLDPAVPPELREVLKAEGRQVDPYPARHNDGSFIVMCGDRDDEDRGPVADVKFCGKAKRGEAWRTEDPEGLARAHLIASAPALYEALKKAAAKFREYEQLHLAKGTHEARMKADVNADMAETCEAALRAAHGDAP